MMMKCVQKKYFYLIILNLNYLGFSKLYNAGLELKQGLDSIHIMMDNRDRATGEAFVEFGNEEDTEKALKKSRDKIGHRWVVWDLIYTSN